MQPIKSVLNEICTQVWAAKTAEVAKQFVITCLESADIDEGKKQQMLNELKTLTNLIKIQQYIANALLKYEGLGTNLK